MGNVGLLSERFESELEKIIDAAAEKVIAARLLDDDIITQQEVMRKYDIKDETLKSWRGAGLTRYAPPIATTRSYYYRKSEIEKFLGMK